MAKTSPKDVERINEKDRRALWLAQDKRDKAQRALQGAQNVVSRSQIALAAAVQDFNELVQRLARQHKLADGSSIDPATGAIARANAQPVVRQ